MYKAFEIAGYSQADVDTNFSGMINAFKYGAPPHGGSAPGIDRIVMLLADEPNIREVVLFPMNQRAEDLMMNAPGEVTRQAAARAPHPHRAPFRDSREGPGQGRGARMSAAATQDRLPGVDSAGSTARRTVDGDQPLGL